MFRRVLLAFVLFPLLAVLAACSGGSGVAPEQPDMSGFFMLNEDESDDPTQLVGMPGRPAGFGGGGGGDAGMALRIEQTDSTLTVSSVGGGQQSMQLFTDGRTVSREMPNGATITTKCSWKDGKLKVETKMSGGRGGTMSTVTTYWLSDDGRRLNVRTLIEGGRMQPVQFTRVYDAGSGS